jgi:hypothetical protein
MFTKLEKFLFLITGCAVAAIFTDSLLKEYKFPEQKQPELKHVSVFKIQISSDANCAIYINHLIEKYTLGPSIVTYTSKRFGIPEDQVALSHVKKVIESMEQECQQIVEGN